MLLKDEGDSSTEDSSAEESTEDSSTEESSTEELSTDEQNSSEESRTQRCSRKRPRRFSHPKERDVLEQPESQTVIHELYDSDTDGSLRVAEASARSVNDRGRGPIEPVQTPGGGFRTCFPF
jgi:hypothetical protein